MRSAMAGGLKSRVSRRLVLALASSNFLSARSEEVLAMMKEMQTREGLTIFTLDDSIFHRWRGGKFHDGGFAVRPALAPDGLALCWGEEFPKSGGRHDYFLMIDSLTQGTRPITLNGQVSVGSAISSGAETILAGALALDGSRRRSLLLLAVGAVLSVHDITRFVTFELAELEDISMSGSGAIAAIGSRGHIQVLELPTANTVYSGTGRFPRLSPDGKRLAFIRDQRLRMRVLADGTETQILPTIRAMGVGRWSPDGRLLLAGAWTKWLALEKQQIVIDTRTGRYASLGALPEGDYGEKPGWIANALMSRM